MIVAPSIVEENCSPVEYFLSTIPAPVLVDLSLWSLEFFAICLIVGVASGLLVLWSTFSLLLSLSLLTSIKEKLNFTECLEYIYFQTITLTLASLLICIFMTLMFQISSVFLDPWHYIDLLLSNSFWSIFLGPVFSLQQAFSDLPSGVTILVFAVSSSVIASAMSYAYFKMGKLRILALLTPGTLFASIVLSTIYFLNLFPVVRWILVVSLLLLGLLYSVSVFPVYIIIVVLVALRRFMMVLAYLRLSNLRHSRRLP